MGLRSASPRCAKLAADSSRPPCGRGAGERGEARFLLLKKRASMVRSVWERDADLWLSIVITPRWQREHRSVDEWRVAARSAARSSGSFWPELPSSHRPPLSLPTPD